MIRIAIVEDDKELLDAIAAVVEEMDDAKLLYTFSNAESALEAVNVSDVEVVVMDLQLPGISGIECIRQLRERDHKIQFLVCTVYDDDEKLFESLKAGATGYLIKSEILEKLQDSIRAIMKGEAPMSPGIARRVIGFLQQPRRPTNYIDLLSTREQEILEYLSKGFRYKEIAAVLELSIETIRKHVANIYHKLEVQSRTDALNKVYPKG